MTNTKANSKFVKNEQPGFQVKRNVWFGEKRFEHTAIQATTMDEIEAGPALSAAKRELVKGFVDKMGGKRVLQRILIANNGMAATKSILSMRQWAYMTLGDERAIEFVAMATRDDLNANAEFIRLGRQNIFWLQNKFRCFTFSALLSRYIC